MTINFNFKKYIKYIFIAIVCILCFNSCNVKALNYVNPSYRLNLVLGGLDLHDLLYSGNGNDLANFYYDNFDSDFGENYVNDVKDYVINTLNYNSFSDFENDYYYIISYRVWDRNNGFGKNAYSLSANMFYVDKSVGTFDVVLEAYSLYGNIGSNNLAYFRLAPSINNSLGSAFYFSILDYDGTYDFTGNTGTISGFRSWDCSSNYTYCRATKNSSTHIYNAYFVDYFESYANRQFFDSNFEFDFVYDSSKFYVSSPDSNYYFSDMTINNTETVYNFGDKIAEGNGNVIPTIPPNINDLGNNSYGVNLNSVNNIFYDYTNDISTIIGCPFDRDFTGNVCYLYDSDIENFDNSNTNVSNSAYFYLYGLINLDSSKYYTLTFRIYSPYDVGIFAFIYHLTNDNTDYIVNIQKRYFKDYSLYKDVVLVFQPTHSGELSLHDIHLTFSFLNNYTDIISTNYSFGVFRSIKISQFDTLPTQEQIENEISKNNLTTISNDSLDSFFTNFNVNDFGLSSIILLPLNFVNSLSNTTCTPLNLPIPKISNVQLPCISSFMSTNFNSIWVIFQLVVNGLIIYRVCINIFYIIKNAYKPDNDNLEVLDL